MDERLSIEKIENGYVICVGGSFMESPTKFCFQTIQDVLQAIADFYERDERLSITAWSLNSTEKEAS